MADTNLQGLTWLRGYREELTSLAATHGVREVRVFGSFARGTETAESDIDFLVECDVVTRGVGPLADFRADAEELLGRRVDVATEVLLRDEVRRGALAEAVPL